MYVESNDLQGYFRKMSNQGTWGDHLTILALANVLQRNIWIVLSSRDNGDNIVIETGNTDGDPLLRSYVSNTHYVSLEPSRELAAIEGMTLINFQLGGILYYMVYVKGREMTHVFPKSQKI